MTSGGQNKIPNQETLLKMSKGQKNIIKLFLVKNNKKLNNIVKLCMIYICRKLLMKRGFKMQLQD